MITPSKDHGGLWLTCLSKFYMKNTIRKKILITGVSGMLGSNLAYYFKNNYDVLGLYNTHPVNISGILTKQSDISSGNSCRSIIQDYCPEIIIHCASLTNIDYCEENKNIAEQVNVNGTKAIVDSIKDKEIKLIYISSDSVYGGDKGNYQETDPIEPRNYYGLSKYNGELEVLKKEGSLILRTNIFGWNIQNKHSIAEWIINELENNRKIEGFTDVYFSSIYTMDIAKVIEVVIQEKINGIFNCASTTHISKFDFILHIAEFFNLYKNLVKPISIDNFTFKAERGKNLSLNVKKLQDALNYKLPSITQSIASFHNDFKNDFHKKIKDELMVNHEKNIKKILPYGRQYIDEEDIKAVIDVLKTDIITQGVKVTEFELDLCRIVGAEYAVAVNSATSALHIACVVAGVSTGDEVITSPITFVASANCAAYCGAKPVFADIDPVTYNISPVEIGKRITKNTCAVIPVHFAGQSCDMQSIQQIIKKSENEYGRKIFIIEDACHALGSLYQNDRVGSCKFSDMAVMSFHPVKHITTGEGGVVFTNDENLYRKLRLLRSHGITGNPDEFKNKDIAFQSSESYEQGLANPWYYEQIYLGYNYRITDFQCALGISQLKKLDVFRKRRREIVEKYNSFFRNMSNVTTPEEDNQCFSNFHLYVLLFDFKKIGISRAQLIFELKKKSIHTQVHYIPVHFQRFYQKNYHTKKGDCPCAEAYYEKCLSIPLYPAMTDEDVERVIYEIKGMIQR
jgi:perosamine synthetase